MALVGSISGSGGVTAVTSSFIPSASTFNLGTPGNKWGTIYANYLTASISSSDGTNPFLKAGPSVTVNYNSLGQWEITGAAGAASSFFVEADLNKIYTTGSVAIGFAAAASSKGSDVFFAVSSSNPAVAVSTFSGAVVASGSLTIKDALSNATMASVSDMGVISGSSDLQIGGNITGSNALLRGDLAINGGDLTSTATSFNLLSTGVTNKLSIGDVAATTYLGSQTGIVIIPGDLFVSGTTVTVDVENITVEDPLIGLGFTTGSIKAPDGDRGFIGGMGGGQNVAFAWVQNSGSFIATKTNSDPSAKSLTIDNLQPIRAASLQVNGTTAQVTSAGTDITVSGSQVDLKAGTTGVNFFRDNSVIVSIDSGSYSTSVNTARIITKNNNDLQLGAASGRNTYVSGSTVYMDAGGLGTIFRNTGNEFAAIEQISANTAYLTAKSPVTTAYVFDSQATALNIGGAATSISIGSSSGLTRVNNSLIVTGSLTVTGSSYIGSDSSDVLQVFALVTGSLLPFGDRVTDLGSATNRWGNIYTGDLHLRNERGDYTLIEEEDFLSIRFNKTGKRYKFVLEAVPELDEK